MLFQSYKSIINAIPYLIIFKCFREKKFVEKRKEKQKLIQNELERAEILKKHNQKAILKELEERLKRSLSISQLEEITLDDQELVLPELTNKMMVSSLCAENYIYKSILTSLTHVCNLFCNFYDF